MRRTLSGEEFAEQVRWPCASTTRGRRVEAELVTEPADVVQACAWRDLAVHHSTTDAAGGDRSEQAGKPVAAKVVIRDAADRVLLVDPTYKPHWDLPGGMAEADEPPRAAAAREVREEVCPGLQIGRLLVVDWVAPHVQRRDQIVFVFDGGRIGDRVLARLRVGDAEISAYRFATVEDAAALLRPDVHGRLVRSLDALESGTTAYDEEFAER
jgi:8-oxo-dGTP diphosphatase